MVKIVEITQSSDTINCDENGKASIQFNVTNITGSSLRVGVDISTEDPAQKAWFSIEGPSEKQLAINATDQFSVQVNAEQGSAEVSAKLGILVYSIENSDEDYTESELVSIKVPAKTVEAEETNNKWLLWLLVGIVIVSLLGVIGYLLYDKFNNAEPVSGEVSSPTALVPDVTGQAFEQAKNKLQSLQFNNISTESRFDASAAKDTVLEQTPKADTAASPDETDMVLVLANPVTTIPDVKDRTFQGAKQRLNEAGFKNIKKESRFFINKPVDTVLEQFPLPDSSASVQDEVVLTVANAGVTVPNVKNKSLSSALKILQLKKLVLGSLGSKPSSSLAKDTVIDQSPDAGLKVEEKTEIKLVISYKTTRPPRFGNKYMTVIQQSGIRFNAAQIKRSLEPALIQAPVLELAPMQE